jgi:MFS family permease
LALTTTYRQGLVHLVLAQGISVTGDMVLLTAASIVVFRETGSVTAVSLLLGLAVIPTILLGPIAGTFADWYSRRRIMLGADLLSAFACLVALAVNQVVRIEASAFVSIVCVASLAAFYRPASQALLPSLVSNEQLGRANSALRLATSVANIAGPAAAAFMVAHGGLEFVLWADAASFLVSAALVFGIRNVPLMGARATRNNAFREAWAGLDYARRSRRIRTITGAIAAVMLVGTLVNAGTLPLVSEALKLSESRYGILLAIEGAGAMGLAVVFLALGPGRRLLLTGSFALIGVGGTTVALGGATGFEVAAVAIFAQGASVVALQVAFASYLQREAIDAFRGRVMSLVSMTSSVAQLAGYAIAGPMVEWMGVRTAFMVAGAAICLVSVPVVSLAFVAAREERAAPAEA